MLDISEKNIKIRPATSKDFPFISSCYNSNEFHLYFDRYELKYDRYWIMEYFGNKIGVVNFDFEDTFGIDTIHFSIYVLPERRMLSAMGIISSMGFILKEYPDIERIEFRVYDNNEVCLALFDQLGIKAECIYPNARYMQQKYVSLHCFALYPQDDLEKISILFHGKFKNG